MAPKRKRTQPSSSASDGPTLPIIGGSAAAGALPITTSNTTTTATTGVSVKARESTKSQGGGSKGAQERKGNTLHPSLFAPWELLDEGLAKDMSGPGKREQIEVVAWSRNQNVRGGVNRVKGFLRGGASLADGGVEVLGMGQRDRQKGVKGKEIMVVSAQGEGTVKLVGILEVARRVVEGAEAASGGGGKIVWNVYTALSSVSVPKPTSNRPGREDADANEHPDDESDDAFEPASKHTHTDTKDKTEPVLSVWFSREEIPGFARAFGAETWVVVV